MLSEEDSKKSGHGGSIVGVVSSPEFGQSEVRIPGFGTGFSFLLQHVQTGFGAPTSLLFSV